jgi:hypothetical protein
VVLVPARPCTMHSGPKLDPCTCVSAMYKRMQPGDVALVSYGWKDDLSVNEMPEVLNDVFGFRPCSIDGWRKFCYSVVQNV